MATPRSYRALMGPLQARKSLGLGPKAKIFSPFSPTRAVATGTKPRICSATSAAVPQG